MVATDAMVEGGRVGGQRAGEHSKENSQVHYTGKDQVELIKPSYVGHKPNFTMHCLLKLTSAGQDGQPKGSCTLAKRRRLSSPRKVAKPAQGLDNVLNACAKIKHSWR